MKLLLILGTCLFSYVLQVARGEIDDTSNEITYSGTWNEEHGSLDFVGTHAYSADTGYPTSSAIFVPSTRDTSSLPPTSHHVIAVAVGSAVAAAGGFVIIAFLVGWYLLRLPRDHNSPRFPLRLMPRRNSPKDVENVNEVNEVKDVDGANDVESVEISTDLSPEDKINIDEYVENNFPLCLIRLSTRKPVRKQDLKSYVKSRMWARDMPDMPNMKLKINEHLGYAIFSHRWSAVEPDYQKLHDVGVDGCTGEGGEKLRAFCEKAQDHGCEFAWSDTCCIDKTNSAELQESLNSMFNWYQKASVCIVHLNDTHKTVDVDWKANMLKEDLEGRMYMVCDQWFKRGWTLQELLAPKKIRFYDHDWQPLNPTPPNMPHSSVNDKESPGMMDRIKSASHIPDDVLKGHTMCEVRDVFKWASGRRTTRQEDMAYSLMGLVNVQLTINYGEGMDAFYRLQEEISKRNPDRGLFVWRGPPARPYSMFAKDPTCFKPFEKPNAMGDGDPDHNPEFDYDLRRPYRLWTTDRAVSKLISLTETSTKPTNLGLFINMSLYDVKSLKNIKPNVYELTPDYLNKVTVELYKELEDAKMIYEATDNVEDDKLESQNYISRKLEGARYRLAILETNFGHWHQSHGTYRAVSEKQVKHAAILLERTPLADRHYWKVNTTGIIWVTPPSEWNPLEVVYVG